MNQVNDYNNNVYIIDVIHVQGVAYRNGAYDCDLLRYDVTVQNLDSPIVRELRGFTSINDALDTIEVMIEESIITF
jgi:hypothetical protein